jgi:hypothetical protein
MQLCVSSNHTPFPTTLLALDRERLPPYGPMGWESLVPGLKPEVWGSLNTD